MIFSMLIVTYLFLGGCAAGMLFMTSVRSLACHSYSSLSDDQLHDYHRLNGRCYAVALVLVAGSCACLLGDLSDPARAYLLFLHPTGTPISVGAWILVVTLIVSSAITILDLMRFRGSVSLGPVRRLLEWIVLPVSLGLMGYTGLFLSLIYTVPFWNSPLVVVLFVLSALSAGCALTSLVDTLSCYGVRLNGFLPELSKLHVVIIVLEIGTLVAFVLTNMARPEVAISRSMALLLSEPLFGWVVWGLGLVGLVIPVILSCYALLTKRRIFTIPADVGCLIGCFLLRYCLIAVGAY